MIDHGRRGCGPRPVPPPPYRLATSSRCERCASAIPAERLEVLPHARFCVPCRQEHND
ncbi:TraR/DksA C4-type zinc finger protein [Actinoplanes utahensis]|uniref:TraR/DksA C4-type zinc finger protein n=1 Tax=Actinoplanes utahensis TaxID=1869 RepID=UPI000A045B1B|nr:TraR/DksA C4-type zinc finger protein [Actinoplanes utahensis]